MADYAKFVRLAQRLIRANGRPVAFERIQREPADPNKPWKGSSTQPDRVSGFSAVFVPASGVPGPSMGLRFVSEDLLKRADQIAMVEPGDHALSEFDTLVDGNVRWRVEFVQELKPGDTTVLYVVGVSR